MLLSLLTILIPVAINYNIPKNSLAVKKACSPQKSHQSCEIKGGGQEMAAMVLIVMTTDGL